MQYKWKFLSGLAWSDIFSDSEGEKIISAYLEIILKVCLILLPLLAGFKILYFSVLFPLDYILFLLALLFGIILYILRKGHTKIASYLFTGVAWVALTSLAAFSDGVKDMAIVAYIVVIFLATLFTSVRFAVFISFASILSVWTMVLFPPRNGFTTPGDPPFLISIDYTVIFLIVVVAVILFSKSYNYSFARITRELQDRTRAEKLLLMNEIRLKEKNEELNIAKGKAEESDRQKSAFINNLSHEIRTPMNGILGFVELLRQPDIDEAKRNEYIAIINSCSMQLASLVNDLIDISKIDAGVVELKISQFESRKLLAGILHMFSKTAKDKGLEFRAETDLDNIVIRSDYGKIMQALSNLVSNAIKFTPEGTVSVRISRILNNLVISVFDTGIGIKEANQKVIFDRFRQADSGLTRSYEGFGLGLAITRGNIEFLGGKIDVYSRLGEGSVFTCTIPVEFIEGAVDLIYSQTVIDTLKKMKILVVEDDEFTYILIHEFLKEQNVELVWAMNGADAVDKFSLDPTFDIVLMDLKMPVMDGYEATKLIKSINPGIPVIAISAFELDKDAVVGLGTYFDGHILKPVEKNDLLIIITQALNVKGL
ncbi:MAG: response regulator [Bacteroidetes bacterium]|nr:response regulator [Bacteroidota bacterium]